MNLNNAFKCNNCDHIECRDFDLTNVKCPSCSKGTMQPIPKEEPTKEGK